VCRVLFDVQVNAAGQNTRGDLETSSVELWDTVINTNARGPFFLMQAVSRQPLDSSRAYNIV